MIGARCGVYQFRNCENDKLYIGASVNMIRRKQEHLKLLRRNSHPSRYLQSAFSKSGEENFIFEVLLLCDPNNRFTYEQVCLDNLKPEYNLLKTATGHGGYWKGKSRKRSVIEAMIKSNAKFHDIILISPNGQIYNGVFNLRKFCRDHNLTHSNIRRMLKGTQKTHKGWKFYDYSSL